MTSNANIFTTSSLFFPISVSGTNVVTFTNCGTGGTSDPESNSVASYSIHSGDDGTNKFQVPSPLGTVPTIQTSGNVLDYETKNMYTLVIYIVDNGSPVLTSTATVYVSVSRVRKKKTLP